MNDKADGDVGGKWVQLGEGRGELVDCGVAESQVR